MTFTPNNTPPPKPLDEVIFGLTTDCTDPSALSQADLEAYRLQLAHIKKLCGTKMAETSTKQHFYDDADISAYIDAILEDGYNLQETELSDYPEFVDAQRLKRWSALIGERVELSCFGSKNFRVHSLRLLRSNIATAKTLHDLRKAVTLMISPLDLWNQHESLVQQYSPKNLAKNDKETDSYIDSLLIEIESKDKLLAERKRVIDSMLTVYQESDEDIAVLRNCESAKVEHNLSDTQAAELFGISRKKLLRLRADIDLNAAPSADSIVVPDLNCLDWHYQNISHINHMIESIAEESYETNPYLLGSQGDNDKQTAIH